MDQPNILPDSKKATQAQIKAIAEAYGYTYAGVRAISVVEGSGRGFDPATGKIKIQFEPAWYRKLDSANGFSGHGVWEENKVEKQPGEWRAFNDAFAKDPGAAMAATSWGMMQVMGFHWAELGFHSVGEMVDFAKESEINQIELGLRFISKSPKLDAALREHNWKVFAYYYNGPNYRVNNYDVRLANEYADACGG